MRGSACLVTIFILLFRANSQTYSVTCRGIARSAMHYNFWLEGEQKAFANYTSDNITKLTAFSGMEKVFTFSFEVTAGSTNTLIIMVYDQHYSSCPSAEQRGVPKYAECNTWPTSSSNNGFKMSCNSVEPNWNKVITSTDQTIDSNWKSTSHNIWPDTAGSPYTDSKNWRWESISDRPNSWGTTSSEEFDPAPSTFSQSLPNNFDDWDTPQFGVGLSCPLCDTAASIWGHAADEMTVNSNPATTSGTGVGDLVDCHLTVDNVLINIYINSVLTIPYEGKEVQGTWEKRKKFSFYIPTHQVRLAVTARNDPSGSDACLSAEFFIQCDTPNTQNAQWRALKQDTPGWLASGNTSFNPRNKDTDPFYEGNWASQYGVNEAPTSTPTALKFTFSTPCKSSSAATFYGKICSGCTDNTNSTGIWGDSGGINENFALFFYDIGLPTDSPTTSSPTPSPTPFPTPSPTKAPSPFPTPNPSPFPTPSPTPHPTPFPTPYPTPHPTPFPTPNPSPFPTPYPTPYPTPFPSPFPTPFPTCSPTAFPSFSPTESPTPLPTPFPTNSPTKSPITQSPTDFPTISPTSESPSSLSPATLSPTSLSPVTRVPTFSRSPTSRSPSSCAPTTNNPTSKSPLTMFPTTCSPVSKEPTSFNPSTFHPFTSAPTFTPTTLSPSTCSPSTYGPSSCSPSSSSPSSNSPSTASPSSLIPTTCSPSTFSPSTCNPTSCAPSTCSPSTCAPSSCSPTSCSPTSCSPSTSVPSSCSPSSCTPTTCNPSTCNPSSVSPSSCSPTSCSPSSSNPTSLSPSTCSPSSCNPTSCAPTSSPTTCSPSSCAPSSLSPSSCSPSTCSPSSLTPTTKAPSSSPTTFAPVFCPVGQYATEGECRDCPYGSYCKHGQSIQQCPLNSNTTAERKTAITDCICNNGFLGNITAFNATNTTCVPCSPGDYCSGGMRQDCPAGSYCPSPAVKYPCIDNGTLEDHPIIYCPARTYEATFVGKLCPAGFFCKTITDLNPCTEPQNFAFYCPPGTRDFQRNCPLNHYCPNTTIAIKCNEKQACKVGSVFPSQCPPGFWCNDSNFRFLCTGLGEFCPTGSKKLSLCPEENFCPIVTAKILCSNGSYCPEGSTVDTPCEPGFFCPTKSSKRICNETGTYCPPGSQEPQTCAAGAFCSNTQSQTTCVLGKYCPEGSTEEKDCPLGSYCPDSKTIIECKIGSYCPSGSTEERPCPLGSFCSFPNTSISCKSTEYCPRGSNSSRQCAVGHACSTPSTQKPCQREGSYCPVSTVIEGKCPAGSYCPNSLEKYPCDKSYFCPEGSTYQRICPEGTECQNPTVSIDCAFGTYCPNGTTAAESCLLGKYCPDTKSIFNCTTGSYCPQGSTQNAPCPEGSYCPNPKESVRCSGGQYCPKGLSRPLNCPTGSFCATPSAIRNCSEGSFCPERSEEDNACEAGSYCPNTSVQIQCKTREYCPQGSVKSQLCPAGFFCPNPSDRITCTSAGEAKYCEEGSTKIGNCPPSFYCPDTSQKIPCNKGFYCRLGTINQNVCPGGFQCPDTFSLPVICPKGTYGPVVTDADVVKNAENKTRCQICPADNFCNEDGLSNSKQCPTGAVSPEGSISITSCICDTSNGFSGTINSAADSCIPAPTEVVSLAGYIVAGGVFFMVTLMTVLICTCRSTYRDFKVYAFEAGNLGAIIVAQFFDLGTVLTQLINVVIPSQKLENFVYPFVAVIILAGMALIWNMYAYTQILSKLVEEAKDTNYTIKKKFFERIQEHGEKYYKTYLEVYPEFFNKSNNLWTVITSTKWQSVDMRERNIMHAKARVAWVYIQKLKEVERQRDVIAGEMRLMIVQNIPVSLITLAMITVATCDEITTPVFRLSLISAGIFLGVKCIKYVTFNENRVKERRRYLTDKLFHFVFRIYLDQYEQNQRLKSLEPSDTTQEAFRNLLTVKTTDECERIAAKIWEIKPTVADLKDPKLDLRTGAKVVKIDINLLPDTKGRRTEGYQKKKKRRRRMSKNQRDSPKIATSNSRVSALDSEEGKKSNSSLLDKQTASLSSLNAHSRRGSTSTPSLMQKDVFDSNTRLPTQRGSISNMSNSPKFERSADAKAKMERGKDLESMASSGRKSKRRVSTISKSNVRGSRPRPAIPTHPRTAHTPRVRQQGSGIMAKAGVKRKGRRRSSIRSASHGRPVSRATRPPTSNSNATISTTPSKSTDFKRRGREGATMKSMIESARRSSIPSRTQSNPHLAKELPNLTFDAKRPVRPSKSLLRATSTAQEGSSSSDDSHDEAFSTTASVVVRSKGLSTARRGSVRKRAAKSRTHPIRSLD